MAEVKIVYLPHGDGGKKQGVDDFFVAGNTEDDLLALATTELRKPPRDEEDEAPNIPYRETPHGLIFEKHTKDGPVPVPLTNFTARITADVVEDDGVEEKRAFEIEARRGQNHFRFDVPGERFAGMNWVSEKMGASAVVYSGFGAKDHSRAAIQLLSGEIETRRVYTHTGWRKIAGGWAFLHNSGAIGLEGPIPGTEVSLGEGGMEDYLFPVPPEGEALERAVRTSLKFLELAPRIVTVPLLAAISRAVLGEAATVDLSLHLAGPTGAYKTELTAIALAHYGAGFNGRNLPANWSNTENALEKQAFIAKDAPLVVDDFAPTGTNHDVARMHRTADRLLRAQGNRSGRGRMNADGSLRRTYHPRGLVVSSGEDTPRGQSLRARMLILEVSPGDVDLEVLTEMQRAAAEGVLAAAMSGFVRWLAPRMDELKETLPPRQRELRVSGVGVGSHARMPDTVASLALGFEQYLEFAEEAGAIPESDDAELWSEGWRALGEAAEAQFEHQIGEEPTRQFLERLTSAIVGGDAHVASAKTGGQPKEAERWGWRSTTIGAGENERPVWQPQGRRIGWLGDDESLLLEPGAAFAASQRTARDQGSGLPIGQRALWKRLQEKGLLASRDSSRGRNTTRATIAGERKTVIHLIPSALSPSGPKDPNDPPPEKKDSSGPKRWASSSISGQETAHQDDPENAESEGFGPKGPLGPIPAVGSPDGANRNVTHTLPRIEPQLVKTSTDLEALLPELREAGRVALDLETTGLNPRQDRIRLMTLATEKGTWLVDCFEINPAPVFPILARKKLLIHNALFDLGFLSQGGFEMETDGEVFDTMLMSQIVTTDPKKKETE